MDCFGRGRSGWSLARRARSTATPSAPAPAHERTRSRVTPRARKGQPRACDRPCRADGGEPPRQPSRRRRPGRHGGARREDGADEERRRRPRRRRGGRLRPSGRRPRSTRRRPKADARSAHGPRAASQVHAVGADVAGQARMPVDDQECAGLLRDDAQPARHQSGGSRPAALVAELHAESAPGAGPPPRPRRSGRWRRRRTRGR